MPRLATSSSSLGIPIVSHMSPGCSRCSPDTCESSARIVGVATVSSSTWSPERVVEVELPLVAELEHGRRRERLRDRADAVLRVRRRRALRREVGESDRLAPDDLAAADDAPRPRSAAARRPARGGRARRARRHARTRTPRTRGTSSAAPSTSASSTSRYVTAAQPPWAEAGEQHALVLEPAQRLALVAAVQRDRDEVRLGGLDRETLLREPDRQPPRALVVVGEPLDVVVERVERRRGHDPRLAHRAAEAELLHPGALDQLGRAGEDGAERTAEPLREADRDRVGEAAVRGGRHAARDRRVEEPRAVEVHGEPELSRACRHRDQLVERPDLPPRAAVRVLHHEQLGRLQRRVGGRDRALDLLRWSGARSATRAPG